MAKVTSEYKKVGIRDLLDDTFSGKVVLPAIQRSFVWDEERIENLFDSIMRNYPVGSFMFWKMGSTDIGTISCYEFMKEYDERNPFSNTQRPIPDSVLSKCANKDYPLCALDGQQRLTALYIGLRGSYTRKEKYKRRKNDSAYPEKKLYFNVLAQEIDKGENPFKFLRTDLDIPCDKNNFWIEVGEIERWKFYDAGRTLQEKIEDKLKYLLGQAVAKDASGTAEECHRRMFYGDGIRDNLINRVVDLYNKLTQDKVLNYCKISNRDLDSVLEIFVRLNNGGMVLKRSDLLFSKIILQWPEAKEIFTGLISQINNQGKFKFDIDFIIRTLWALYLPKKTFNYINFNQEIIGKIKAEKDKWWKAIYNTAFLLNGTGFCKENIKSYNAIIPIVDYAFRFGIQNSTVEIENIKLYFILAQLKQIFGAAANAAIQKTVEVVEEEYKRQPKQEFDVKWFNDLTFVGEKTFEIDEKTIDGFLELEKGEYSFMVLSLLYPNIKYGEKTYHQDHLHPESKLKKLGKENRNCLPNLQLLEGIANKEKNDEDLAVWLANGNTDEYLPQYSTEYPYKDYAITHYDDFYNARKQILRNKLLKVFSIQK